MINLPSSKWTNFPETYRNEAVREVLRWVTLGESGVVVGTSGTGKSNIAGYLANRPDIISRYLPQGGDQYCFLLFDFNGLPVITTANLYRTMLDIIEEAIFEDETLAAAMQQIMARITNVEDILALYRALQRAHQLLIERAGMQVIWLFDRFDEGCQRLDADTLNSLRSLRDRFKDQLVYVAFTRAPLTRLRNPAEYDEFHEIMVMHTAWVGAMGEEDGQWVAHQVRSRYSQTGALLPQGAVGLLYELCGGWPALLKVSYTALADGDLSTRDNGEAMQAKLLAYPPFVRNCQELWSSCSADEQALLRLLAEHGDDAQIRIMDLRYLQQIGLVAMTAGETPTIFSPLFAEFIRRQHEHHERGIRIHKGLAQKDGVPLPAALTDQEFRLLEYFCRHADEEVCLHYDLERYLWPDETDEDATLDGSDRLRALVARLRRKIGDTRKDTPWRYIHAVHGRGYRFVQPPSENGA